MLTTKTTEFSVIGKRNPKIEAYAKASGETKYAGDLRMPRMAWGRLLRSPHAHARVVSIDVSRALAYPGVYAVATGAEMPVLMGIMPTTQDEYPLAVDKVRYVGDPVAAVAAVDEETAGEACELIDVVYEVLPAIMTIDEALTREDVKIHAEARRANVHKEAHLEFGDVEQAFAEADYVREDEFFFEGTTHAPMENYAAVAHWDLNDKITIWTSTQVPHYLHRELSSVFGIPKSRIRVIAPPVGGGFGGKSDPFSHEFAACLLSKKCGRPVKFVLDREETFYGHRGRHPVKMIVKTGVKNDGSITGVHFQSFLDGGAYASYGIASTYYTGALLPVTYRIPVYKFDGVRVNTNKPACGPKRGHGTTQPRFAFECQLDKIAEHLGLDPGEYRLRILTPPNTRTVNQLRVTSSAQEQCIEQVMERSGWKEKWSKLPLGKGIGIASSCYISGAGLPIYWNDMPHSGAQIKVDRGGGVTLYCGVSDIGQGCDSTLAYIAAEELGIEPEDIQVVAGDTGLSPVDLGSYSSRVTFMAGNATLQAARRMRELIFQAAAEKLDVPLERLGASWRQVYDEEHRERCLDWEDACIAAETKFGTLATVGSYKPPKLAGDYKGSGVGPTPAYSFTACVAQVEVDVETGELKVEKLWLAHDCGRALNPLNVEGQVEGSAYMGLGEILFEESRFRGVLHQKPSLLEYRLLTSLDMPPVEVIIVENPDSEGPYGAKEAGEGPLNPVPPAVANAVYNAIGVRFDATPITRDKILRGLEEGPTVTLRLPKFSYAPAHSLDEAVALLADHGPNAMVVAGGTDVYPNMKRRVWQPEALIGLRGVRELHGIGEGSDGALHLGASTTLTQVATSASVHERYPALATAAHLISTPQLRNMGTIGGNICLDTRCFYYDQSAFWRKALGYCMKAEGDVCRVALSSPKCLATFSADTVPTLIGYGASIRLVGSQGERTVLLSDLYQNDGMDWLKIQPGEILTGVDMPDPAGLRATYYKLRDRGSFDFPIAGVFAGVRTDQAGLVDQARIVLTGVYSMPTILSDAEQVLLGNRLEPDVIAAAAEAAYARSRPVDNTAGTIIQRRRTIRVFVRRALEELAADQGPTGGALDV